MDLSVFFLNSVYFLHLIDMYSRFSLSKVINDKKAETVIDAVIKMWIGTGLGSPEKNSFLQWREILQQRI